MCAVVVEEMWDVLALQYKVTLERSVRKICGRLFWKIALSTSMFVTPTILDGKHFLDVL